MFTHSYNFALKDYAEMKFKYQSRYALVQIGDILPFFISMTISSKSITIE
jgi:hypothetical protein